MGWTPLDLLPGLWVGMLGALLALALRRWYDPVPGWCQAVFGGLVAALFGPALLAGRVLLPLGYLTLSPPYALLWPGPPPGNLIQGDLVLQVAPWLHLVREAFAAGEWPLWNHLAGAGEPLLGNPQAQALQPLAWLALVFPVAAAAGILAALRVLLALTFSFLLLRRQGLAAASASGGSLVFGLSGYLLNWVGFPLGGSAAFLPLLLYAMVLVDERGFRRDRLLLALAGAGALLVGHPETTLYVALLAAAFGLTRLRRRPAGTRLPLLGAWALAAALGLGLAAPALLPQLRYLPQTRRAELLAARQQRLQQGNPLAGWRDPEARQGMARRLLPVVAPHAFGNDRFGRYWGERNVLNDSAGWAGTAALLAFLLALLPGEKRRFPQERLALGTALASLVVLARPPGLIELLGSLPLLGQSASQHSRVSLLLAWSLSFLAACLVERWRRGELRRGAVVLAAAILAPLLAWAYLAHPHPRDPSALAGLRTGSLALHLAALAGAALLLLLRPVRPARPATLALLFLLGAEPLLLRLPTNPSAPAELFYPATAPIAFLKERLAPGERIAGIGPALRPNLAALHGLADARSSNPARPAAYLEAIRRINSGATQATDSFADPSDPLWDLLGIRFVVTAPRARLPFPRVFRRASAWIYERPDPLPRIFLPAEERSALALTALRPAHLTARARRSSRVLLASSIYQDGGWSVLAEGRLLPTDRAPGPFLAAWLPPGQGRLDLLYRPPGYFPGLLFAALSFASLCAWTAPPPRGLARGGRAGGIRPPGIRR